MDTERRLKKADAAAMRADTSRRPPGSPLQRAVQNTILLALATVSVPLTVFIDLFIIGNYLGERSLTECGQALVLLVSVVLFAHAARRRPEGRGFYRLVAGFFLCCLIREMDLLLDDLLFHGAWAPLASAAALLAILRALRVRSTLLPGAEEFAGTRSFVCVQVGLVVVIVLSRTLGSGTLFWSFMGDDAIYRPCKTIVQEALESFGYLLVGAGAILLHREIDRGLPSTPRD
ncbi:MAG: hypothetical protein ACOX5G_11155 [Kiritimatiellia bacterium]|jgi:hypothetical protein